MEKVSILVLQWKVPFQERLFWLSSWSAVTIFLFRSTVVVNHHHHHHHHHHISLKLPTNKKIFHNTFWTYLKNSIPQKTSHHHIHLPLKKNKDFIGGHSGPSDLLRRTMLIGMERRYGSPDTGETRWLDTWRIIPVSKWLLTMVSKSPK